MTCDRRQELSKDAAAQISALPMENLSRPVLAMALR